MRARCPFCETQVACYVPKLGDGSAVALRAHSKGRKILIRNRERCEGSGELVAAWEDTGETRGRPRTLMKGHGFEVDLDKLHLGPKGKTARTETAQTMTELAGLMRKLLGLELPPWQEALLEAWEADLPTSKIVFRNNPGPGKASFCRALERALKHKSPRPPSSPSSGS